MRLWTCACVLMLMSAPSIVGVSATAASAGKAESTFVDDLAFLVQYTPLTVLTTKDGRAQVVVAPAWQGRVMTSTDDAPSGRSFGWLNRSLIASGRRLEHFNPLGGEDRLWLGPEGGQFSVYFAPGAPFSLDRWYVPQAFDTLPFEVDRQSENRIALTSRFSLKNYSATEFQVVLHRDVQVLEPDAAWRALGVTPAQGTSLVAYESRNTLTNAGQVAWTPEKGLLSIWILGMFNPSARATIVIPIRPGTEAELGRVVTSDYFGTIPTDRLKTTETAVFLSGDGQFRGKIGVSPRRSLGRLGSYDATHQVLTIVQFDQPEGVTDYVNSLWRIQSDPYGGDAANAYNDGPAAPGVPPMGPFYELESSSPAAALAPGSHLTHTHRTLHLVGPPAALDAVARTALGVPLADIEGAFRSK